MFMGKPYHDKETLKQLYHDQRLGIAEISDKFDVAESTIWTWLDRHEIEIRHWGSANNRFEEKYTVDEETGCWWWYDEPEKGVYGGIMVDGEQMGAHRYSYQKYNGEIPEGALICHKCHNRSCVNPDHLYAGDGESNAQDAIDNGDWPELLGEDQGVARLSNEEAKELRHKYATTDTTYQDLRKEYGVSIGTVSRVVRGLSYQDAGGPTDTDTHVKMNKRGEEVSNSKLTESDVREIREIHDEENPPASELAEQFGVSRTQIYDVVNRKVWTHVD